MIYPIINTKFTAVSNPHYTRFQNTQPAFCGAKKDIFVSTLPKISKLSAGKLEEVFPIYLRYRESANVKSSIEEVKQFLIPAVKKYKDEIAVARVQDKIVGFLHYGTELSTLRNAERIRLKAMFVDEEHRGKGIAQNLLEKVKELAGDKEIIVKARRSNEKSPYLYLNHGFKEDQEYVHLVYKQQKKFAATRN